MTVPTFTRICGALLLAGALAACSSSSTGSGQPTQSAGSATVGTSSPSASPSAGSSSASAAEGTTHVDIRNFLFEPAALTLSPGATLTVTNQDSTAHTLTADDKSFDTGTIAPGATATITAPQQSGPHAYICTIHPFMHGTLTVS
ncbi:cupredoxin domain-containing protein [Kitasatospora sp. NPDC091207]|uniref:cupredoxin domain-containing protein n=1 Tax=Kitasatospora sp. NPDC091207 TaxID=3364083 RepID=UPI003811AB98